MSFRGGTRRSSYRRNSYRRSGERYVSDYDRQEKRKAEEERTQSRFDPAGVRRVNGKRHDYALRDESQVHDNGRVEGRVEEGPRSARDQERDTNQTRDEQPSERRDREEREYEARRRDRHFEGGGNDASRDDAHRAQPTHAEAQEWAWKRHRRNFDDLSRDDQQKFYNDWHMKRGEAAYNKRRVEEHEVRQKREREQEEARGRLQESGYYDDHHSTQEHIHRRSD